MSDRRIANAMEWLGWHTNCARERAEGWYAKDCRELKLRRKCDRCNALIRIEKLMRGAA